MIYKQIIHKSPSPYPSPDVILPGLFLSIVYATIYALIAKVIYNKFWQVKNES